MHQRRVSMFLASALLFVYGLSPLYCCAGIQSVRTPDNVSSVSILQREYQVAQRSYYPLKSQYLYTVQDYVNSPTVLLYALFDYRAEKVSDKYLQWFFPIHSGLSPPLPSV